MMKTHISIMNSELMPTSPVEPAEDQSEGFASQIMHELMEDGVHIAPSNKHLTLGDALNEDKEQAHELAELARLFLNAPAPVDPLANQLHQQWHTVLEQMAKDTADKHQDEEADHDSQWLH